MMKGSTDEERGSGASSPASTETTEAMSGRSTSEERRAGASEQPGDRDVQGTWGLAASEILGEQQPAGASPWA